MIANADMGPDAKDSIAIVQDTGPETGTVYVTGHPEYAKNAIAREYERDLQQSQGNTYTPEPSGAYQFAPEQRAPWEDFAQSLYGAWLAQLKAPRTNTIVTQRPEALEVA